MEMNKVEVEALDEVVTCAETQVTQLDDLQLALVGGGIGIVIVA